jgi:two-component system chemotaxis response regulator CheY
MESLAKNFIYIIEDDTTIRELLVELLESENYFILSAKNGQEAIDQLRSMQRLPDLLLLDLMMPIKDGIGFREDQVKDSRLKNIPTLLMSADSDIEAKKVKMGIKSHLKKPLDIEVLLAVIKAHLFDLPQDSRTTIAT